MFFAAFLMQSNGKRALEEGELNSVDNDACLLARCQLRTHHPSSTGLWPHHRSSRDPRRPSSRREGHPSSSQNPDPDHPKKDFLACCDLISLGLYNSNMLGIGIKTVAVLHLRQSAYSLECKIYETSSKWIYLINLKFLLYKYIEIYRINI